MKLIKILSIMMLFLSMPNKSYTITKNIKVWGFCAATAAISGYGTMLCVDQAAKAYRKAHNWDLQKEIKKQHEKELNAHTMLEKLRAYHDSFSVNRFGKINHYAEAISWGTSANISGIVTSIAIVLPFVITDKQLRKH